MQIKMQSVEEETKYIIIITKAIYRNPLTSGSFNLVSSFCLVQPIISIITLTLCYIPCFVFLLEYAIQYKPFSSLCFRI